MDIFVPNSVKSSNTESTGRNFLHPKVTYGCH